jgi:Fe2+ or Zn2+ uptake regulation protein
MRSQRRLVIDPRSSLHLIGMVSSSIILTQITEALKQSGARMTKKRAQILSAMGACNRPVTAEEIRKLAGLPRSDLVTVYRNLEAFEAIHALQRIPLESGTQLFELTAPGEHYHHLICRVCHRAERLDLCIGSDVEDRASAQGYTGITHLLEVYGVCEACADVA